MTTLPAGEPFPLGPGTLHIGQTGTLIDVSCLVNNAVISSDKDQGDDVTKLCGDVVPGAVTYSYTLSGNMDTDVAEDAGFFALSWAQAGAQLDYDFTPSTAAGTKAAGKLVIDPLDFGGDEMSEAMASDFEFALVGKPVFTYSGATAAGVQRVERDDVDQQRETVDA
jgi:hypothetical protein